MRKLKFRAWRGGKMLSPARLDQIADYNDLAAPYGREDTTVMQFTGLHDKSGKEIYEGDIIQHENIWRVVWNDKHACFEFRHQDGEAPRFLAIKPCRAFREV